MHSPRKRTLALAAAGLTLALATAAQAQSQTSQSQSGVTVHRGAEVSVLQNGVEGEAATSTGVAGVSVARGHGAPPRAEPEVVVIREAPGVPQVAAGEAVWLLDADNGRLMACELVETANLGASKIRCRSRDLPR